MSSPALSKLEGRPPETYLDYFKNNKVKAIVRLNEKLYVETLFIDNDIRIYKMEQYDGSNPNIHAIINFITICENEIEESGNAIAVHCRAGLGRTGTLICVYLMFKYHIDP